MKVLFQIFVFKRLWQKENLLVSFEEFLLLSQWFQKFYAAEHSEIQRYIIKEKVTFIDSCSFVIQLFESSLDTLEIIILYYLPPQRLCTIKKPSNVKITCVLYHLKKFYTKVGNKQQMELMAMVEYLSKKPEQMCEPCKMKNALVITYCICF